MQQVQEPIYRVSFETPLMLNYIYAERKLVMGEEPAESNGDPFLPEEAKPSYKQVLTRYVHVFPLTAVETHSKILARAYQRIKTLHCIELVDTNHDTKQRFVSFTDDQDNSYTFELVYGEPYTVGQYTYKWHAIPQGDTRDLTNKHWIIQLWNSLIERFAKRQTKNTPVKTEHPKSDIETTRFVYAACERTIPKRVVAAPDPEPDPDPKPEPDLDSEPDHDFEDDFPLTPIDYPIDEDLDIPEEDSN